MPPTVGVRENARLAGPNNELVIVVTDAVAGVDSVITVTYITVAKVVPSRGAVTAVLNLIV